MLQSNRFLDLGGAAHHFDLHLFSAGLHPAEQLAALLLGTFTPEKGCDNSSRDDPLAYRLESAVPIIRKFHNLRAFRRIALVWAEADGGIRAESERNAHRSGTLHVWQIL